MLREVVVTVDEAGAEPLSDALLAQGALSVSVEDAQAETADEQPLYGEPGMPIAHLAWRCSRLVILVDAGTDPAQLLAAAAAEAGTDAPAIEALRPVADADWVRLTQAQFPPTRSGARLWIVPTWHAPPEPSAINLRLDPGVAFGTGTHPTTQLCLAWLESQPLAGRRVLDYGCGSGILAVAAALLGARAVWGTDIDPQAVDAARQNSRANGIGDALARYTLPDSLPTGPDATFDIVLANILANPLKLLAPALLARVAPGGALVLAGILERQTAEMIDLYARMDPQLRLSAWRTQDGWVCLAGTRTVR
ncbi:MAG: 50S ribosomal protein L11 methyltransferase [Burkholderiaceae bacterium]|jgi:ribosomal protein L11 methyltransferase|nr:50S ribosomal protein L11 methyltransferase [Burkholderiaceae bacterium]